jgi:oligoribonuclease NrnB/cAMP/cGMP phosphodiesterase (DHH superfamily)
MLCLHHNDLDGHCAAALLRQIDPNVKFYEMNYSDKTPWHLIQPGDTVFVVDYVLPPDDMFKLRDTCAQNDNPNEGLVWIDHHKTAIAWADQAKFACKGLREIGRAGCELTWAYLFPGCEMPDYVRWLGRYDVWDHADPDVLPFQYGMRVQAHAPGDGIWDVLANDDSMESEIICVDGRAILQYVKITNAEMLMRSGFVMQWEGLTWLCINGQHYGSAVFESKADPTRFDAAMAYHWNGQSWYCSLSSINPNIDVSDIAVKYGGGGHAGAAGFRPDSLPFEAERKSAKMLRHLYPEEA